MLSASFLLRAMQRLPFGWGEARRWLLPRLASQVGPSIRSEIYGRRCEFHLDNTCESKFLMSPLAYNRTEIDFVLSGLKQNGATFVDILSGWIRRQVSERRSSRKLAPKDMKCRWIPL